VTAGERQRTPVRIHVYAFQDFGWPNLSGRELPDYTPIGRTVVPVVAADQTARADAIGRATRFLAAASH